MLNGHGIPGGPVTTGHVDTGVTDSQLAVLLRQAQWALDDVAHELPAGRATVGRRVEVARTLEAVAVVLRCSAPAPPCFSGENGAAVV